MAGDEQVADAQPEEKMKVLLQRVERERVERPAEPIAR
jgi:hypothetical protein